MDRLSEEGRRVVADIARRHGFSVEATTAMLFAVATGHGSQAQFSDPEFGGMGQWSSGGMIMIGDMFNTALSARVSALCQDLANVVRSQTSFVAAAQSQTQSQGSVIRPEPLGQQSAMSVQQQASGAGGSGGGGESLFVPGAASSSWWPTSFGQPGSTGAQNNLRYAYFPAARRLAIDVNGAVTVYDTGPHQIGGFSQQQSGDQSLTFTSQLGVVRVADLPIVDGRPTPANDSPATTSTPLVRPAQPSSAHPEKISGDEIVALLEKLAGLRAKGILTDAEFETKKAELLGRL